MKLLDKYLLSQYIKYFLTVNIAFVSLYVLIDFFDKIDDFSNKGHSIWLVIQYFALNIPFVVDQLSPILILLSGVIVLGILNHSNELVALKAGGIPLKLILKPIILAGIGMTMLFLAVAQFILPTTISITNQIWFEQVKGRIQLGIYRNGRYYFKGKEGFYSFEWKNKKFFVFNNFSYSIWSDDHKLETLVASEVAGFEKGRWILTHGQIHKERGGEYRARPFGTKHLELPETPEDFLIPQYDNVAMSITNLFFDIFKKDTEEQQTKAWAEFFGRISYIFLGMPLLFMGLPILLISYQRWGKDLSIAIPASCGMAFLAWGLWGTLQSLAKAGALPPYVAGTVIHVLFTVWGLYLLKKLNN